MRLKQRFLRLFFEKTAEIKYNKPTGKEITVVERAISVCEAVKRRQTKIETDTMEFIEKYGFGLPYQVTLFKDKENLKIYMVDRLKTSFTGESQSYEPVIMENDKLM